jgi:hypothetical protein
MKGALLKSGTDAEKPEIITISPPTGSMLPANPTIGILVEDNYKVASVTAEYRVQADQLLNGSLSEQQMWINTGYSRIPVEYMECPMGIIL